MRWADTLCLASRSRFAVLQSPLEGLRTARVPHLCLRRRVLVRPRTDFAPGLELTGMTRRRSYIASTRSSMYSFAKLLGDVRAVQTGTVPRRVKNRIVGRSLSRLFR